MLTVGACNTDGRDEKCIQTFDRKFKGKRLFGRLRHSRTVLEWVLGK